MADVKISQLSIGIPTGNSLIPYSSGNNTLATAVSSLTDFKPVFSGQISDASVTSATTLKFNSVLVHRGNWYNSSTGKFTAPLNGLIQVNAYCLIGAGGGAGYSQADLWFRINDIAVAAIIGAGTYWNTGIITSVHSVNRGDILDFYGPTNQAGGGYIYGGYNSFSIMYL